MKNTIKFLKVLVLTILVSSCSSDDDAVNTFGENVNSERFTGIELGNSDFVLPQTNVDVHVEFDYAGTSKVTKIVFDVMPNNVPNIKTGEVAWELKEHVVPVDKYEGQLNPHIHYHVYFDEDSKYEPTIKPAEGIYDFKITVQHEDGTTSKVTKQMHIIQKFMHLEVGHDQTTKFGTNELHTDFEYNSGNNAVKEIRYQLWFEEWRTGQNVEVGKWDNIITILPEALYKGIKNPDVHYDLQLPEGAPIGGYWLNIYAEEEGEKEAVKLSVPFKIVE